MPAARAARYCERGAPQASRRPRPRQVVEATLTPEIARPRTRRSPRSALAIEPCDRRTKRSPSRQRRLSPRSPCRSGPHRPNTGWRTHPAGRRRKAGIRASFRGPATARPSPAQPRRRGLRVEPRPHGRIGKAALNRRSYCLLSD